MSFRELFDTLHFPIGSDNHYNRLENYCQNFMTFDDVAVRSLNNLEFVRRNHLNIFRDELVHQEILSQMYLQEKVLLQFSKSNNSDSIKLLIMAASGLGYTTEVYHLMERFYMPWSPAEVSLLSIILLFNNGDSKIIFDYCRKRQY
jgi:hypothetical protein